MFIVEDEYTGSMYDEVERLLSGELDVDIDNYIWSDEEIALLKSGIKNVGNRTGPTKLILIDTD